MKARINAHKRATRLIGATLFAGTAGLFLWLPSLQPAATADAQPPAVGAPAKPSTPVAPDQRPDIEVVFVLDTTGSMGGLIQTAKDKIWSIASTMASAEPAPRLRMGLVGYRDRGDDYVTRVIDLTADLDQVHAALFQFQANGGGDGPESVNQALDEAVNAISWGQSANAYRAIFLVGDAEPHMDYQDDVKYPQALALARERGIRVNAIQCGSDGRAREHWQRVAQLGDGAYFNVAQDGAAVAITTPYDEALARLSVTVDDTRLYYGSRKERAERDRAMAESRTALASAPAPVLARRAAFAATPSGKGALLGERELIEEVSAGRIALEDIAPAELPEPLKGLSSEEQKALVAQAAENRAKLRHQMEETVAKRAEWLRAQVAASGAAEGSLDHKLYDTVRAQTRDLGLDYAGDGPAY